MAAAAANNVIMIDLVCQGNEIVSARGRAACVAPAPTTPSAHQLSPHPPRSSQVKAEKRIAEVSELVKSMTEDSA